MKLYITRYSDDPARRDLLMLHGFLGSGKQFLHLIPELRKRVNPVTLDFEIKSGNGKSTGMQNKRGDTGTATGSAFTTETLVEALQSVISGFLRPEPFLLGYSMGGRLSLSWAVRHAGQLSGLILESSTPGIKEPGERENRRQTDAARALEIRSNFTAFLERWESNPLFQRSPCRDNPVSDSTPVPPDHERSRPGAISPLAFLRKIQHQTNPETAAQWLNGFGTGTMPPLWSELYQVTCPVLLITGSADTKFCNIATQMSGSLPRSRHETVSGAAHRVHIDQPDAYLSLILSFIQESNKQTPL